MSFDDRDSGRERPRGEKGGGACLYWSLGCGGVGIVFLLLCCGGVGYLGSNLMSTEVELVLRDNAQIREHLGELSSVRVNFIKSMTHDGDDIWVYDLAGAKGKGELTTNQTSEFDGEEVFHSATLRLSDGRTVEIEMNSGAADPEAALPIGEPAMPVETPPVTPSPTTDPAPASDPAKPE